MLSYQNTWERRSSIRSRPRKLFDFSIKAQFFPVQKFPLLFHEASKTLCEENLETCLLHCLYRYLHNIINLETHIIVEACHSLIFTDLPFTVSEDEKIAAQSILIDEQYHVYTAMDLLSQLRSQFPSFDPITLSTADTINALSNAKHQLQSSSICIFEILAVCIFETTIVKELVEFFNSPDVHSCIQYYVRDHMNDETRHFGFFAKLLNKIWEQTPNHLIKEIAPLIGPFIKDYLNTTADQQFYHQLLQHIGCDPKLSATIIKDLYSGFKIDSNMPIVNNVIQVLQKANILNHPLVENSFATLGLIEQPSTIQ